MFFVRFLLTASCYPCLQSEEIYTYQDLYVGGTVEVYNRTLEMIEGDEYTYTYMENNKHICIMADHEILLKSLGAQVRGAASTEEILAGWGRAVSLAVAGSAPRKFECPRGVRQGALAWHLFFVIFFGCKHYNAGTFALW